jgi:hypothetical protein
MLFLISVLIFSLIVVPFLADLNVRSYEAYVRDLYKRAGVPPPTEDER